MTSIESHIDRYLHDLQAIRRSPQTITWYEKRLRPLRGLGKPVNIVSFDDLDGLYLQLSTQTTQYAHNSSHPPIEHKLLAPATLRGYVRAWRAFFNWLCDRDVIESSPARKLKLPSIPAQPPKAISRADMEKIVEAARQSSARDYAIVCILADSACRVGGLCNITLDNLDLDHAQAIVVEKGQLRFLLFTPRTIEAIRACLSERPAVPYSALFIGQRLVPLKPGGIHALLDRLAAASGITDRPQSARLAARLGAGRAGDRRGHQRRGACAGPPSDSDDVSVLWPLDYRGTPRDSRPLHLAAGRGRMRTCCQVAVRNWVLTS